VIKAIRVTRAIAACKVHAVKPVPKVIKATRVTRAIWGIRVPPVRKVHRATPDLKAHKVRAVKSVLLVRKA
jgi:hypothetical protein